MQTRGFGFLTLTFLLFCSSAAAGATLPAVCKGGLVTADVVALDQPIWNNRLGTNLPGGMVFALKGDVCAPGTPSGAIQTCGTGAPGSGTAMLKPYKRPRPLVLRVNRGQCLQVNFTNWLSAAANTNTGANGQPPTGVAKNQPTTRAASLHVQGLEWVANSTGGANSCSDSTNFSATCNDASWIGNNPSSLVQPGQSATYTLFASHEGTFVLYSSADTFSNPAADGGQLQVGLFGAVHVEPTGSEYYRSQVTQQDLCYASQDRVVSPTTKACTRQNPSSLPKINYAATYPFQVTDACYTQGTCRVGPVLNMVSNGALVASDLTAILTGPKAGRFIGSDQEPPIEESSYALPDRLEPYREITTIYHEVFGDTQAFSSLYTDNTLSGPLTSARDSFAINYGMGGIGSEILANRLGVGPMADCTTCKYEEFFLTSWAVGDPAMVVDVPADTTCSGTAPSYSCTGGNPATLAFYPDDPSNVYHTYIADHTRFRILHGGSDLHHLHHQHAHQWIHSPDTSDGDYTDSQSIGPGSAFTLEMVYNGGGNVNQTVGDSIFHCHFYPHFAGGMWSLWRVHDVFEAGTVLDANGRPVTGVPNRALPDGEIVTGTPIPALVPMPTIPMAPLPAPVQLAQGAGGGTVVELCDSTSTATQCNNPTSALAATATGRPVLYRNPGYPFFIPGIGGQRAPHPPADFASVCSDNGAFCTPAIGTTAADVSACATPSTALCVALDGGLPRHLALADGETGCTPTTTGSTCPGVNATDYSRVLENIEVEWLADRGTFVEQVAMGAHSRRQNSTAAPSGAACVINSYNPPPSGDATQCEKLSAQKCTTNPFCRLATFLYNGLPPAQGAPFADPCIQYTLAGGPLSPLTVRQYRAADIQLDATFNREGWHFPQQRILSLWGDVQATLTGARPPEPLFFRANSGECIEYTLANLVPNVYELDDFQVRTPTDILGQHIHLVKFDVTSSDGATNGFNYEDGTFSPDEVTERIRAIRTGNACTANDPRNGTPPCPVATALPFFGPGPGGRWVGAQATVQRWWADPLLNQTYQDPGVDRTLRTVFTHDHFGPSTHQQAGLYAGLVIEPDGSGWYSNDLAGPAPFGGITAGGSYVGSVEVNGASTGQPGPGRPVQGVQGPPVNDGGPTSWQAVIQTETADDGFREFVLEIQDSTLTYESFSGISAPGLGGFCSNNPALACTPATAGTPADTTACNSPNAVCYANGFCSTSTSIPCQPATWQSAENVENCPASIPGPPATANTATCNLVPGVPSTSLVAGLTACTNKVCTVGGAACTTAADCINLGSWASNPVDPKNQPEIITLTAATYNFSVNYRNEPLFPRLATSTNPADLSAVYTSVDRGYLRGTCSNDGTFCTQSAQCANGGTCALGGFCSPQICTPGSGVGCSGGATCLSTGICSDLNDLCTQGSTCSSGTCSQTPYAPLTAGLVAGDPVTPLLRAYAGDDIQVRTLVGGHINPHNFTIHGMNWLMEPSFVDSGWRNSQVMGISEHFEAVTQVPPFTSPQTGQADYLYMPGAAAIEQAGGNWGLLRAYGSPQTGADYLRPLPQNPPGSLSAPVCPGKVTVTYDIVATTVQQAINGPLTYNTTPSVQDANAILYVNLSQLVDGAGNPCTVTSALDSCKLPAGNAPEPLVLRAPAGACIQVTLFNAINPASISLTGATNNVPPKIASTVSTTVGLHPQLASFDVTAGSGFNAGTNPLQTVAAGSGSCNVAGAQVNCASYTWYAGNLDPGQPAGSQHIPIEFGSANLIASDPLNHYQHGLYGALVIEPADWQWDPTLTGTSALILSASAGNFREAVVFTPDGMANPPSTPALASDKLNTVNYNSPLLASRVCSTTGDLSCVLSSSACCGTVQNGQCSQPCAAPTTFTACAGDPVRFRVLHPGGINTNSVFELYGHNFSESPYQSSGPGCTAPTTQTNLYSSSVIGTANTCTTPASAGLNEWEGSHMGIGPQNHWDIFVEKAGGTGQVPGDYLFRSYSAFHFSFGYWGIFRVMAPGSQGAPKCATS